MDNLNRPSNVYSNLSKAIHALTFGPIFWTLSVGSPIWLNLDCLPYLKIILNILIRDTPEITPGFCLPHYFFTILIVD